MSEPFAGIIDVTEDDPLTLTVTPNGTVMLGTSEGAFRFRTQAAYDRALDAVDRERAGWGYQQTFETDAYHERFQRLCVERGELAAPPLRGRPGGDAA